MKSNPNARLASFYGLRLFDTIRVVAGTALPLGETEMFAVPVGNTTTELNGTTQYQKTFQDTNMRNTRQLPQGQEAWITSIQARVLISGSLDDTVQTSGQSLGLANAPGLGNTLAAGDDVLAVNLAQAVYESVYLRFLYNQVTFEEAPLWGFPSRYGVSGFAGGYAYVPGTAGTTIAQNEVAVNNGFGFPFQLPMLRHIDSLYQFSVGLQSYNNFVPTRNFRIQVILEGLGAKSVTG